MTSGILFMVLFSFVQPGSNSANLEKCTNEAEHEFEAIVKSKYFVDKSLLIQEIFKSPGNMLITVPSGWGKSANLKMLKTFIELQVNEDCQTITKASRKRNIVNDTSNYHLFIENSLKITKNKKIMDRHFGKYPVIEVNFKCKHKIKDSEFSVICFREIIHNAIRQHKYLCKSEMLTMKEKRFVDKWSDINGKYEEFYGQDVTKALHKLAIILNKQFLGRRIILLIDNYEDPSSEAMFRVKDGKELNRVLKFNLNIIATVLNTANKYKCKAVIMGKSYITAAGIYKFDQTQFHSFLGNHTLQKYFGLSKNEINNLFMNAIPKLTRNDIDLFYAFYGGFITLGGTNVFSLNSVLNFLDKKTFKISAHQKFDLMRYLKLFCKINFMRKKIEELAVGNVIDMGHNEVFTINDMINLRDIVVKDKSEDQVPENILFYFFLEQGYLTISQNTSFNNSSLLFYELPNLEVKYMVGQKLKKYYDEIYLPDKALLTKCVNFFKSISSSLSANPIQFKRALYWFYTTFEKLIKFRWTRFKEKYVYRLLFSVFYHFDSKNLKNNFVVVSESNRQFYYLLVDKKVVFSVGLKITDSSKNVLENLVQKFSNGSKYFNLIPTLRKKKHIFIAIGVESNLRLTVSCLPQGNYTKSAFHIP